MRAANFSPDDTEFGVLDFGLSFVNISDTLSAIEIGIVSGMDTINLQQSARWVRIGLISFVAKNDAFAVETYRLLRLFCNLGFLAASIAGMFA